MADGNKPRDWLEQLGFGTVQKKSFKSRPGQQRAVSLEGQGYLRSDGDREDREFSLTAKGRSLLDLPQ